MQDSHSRSFAQILIALGGVISLAGCQEVEPKADEPAAITPSETLTKISVPTPPPAAMPPTVEVAGLASCQSNSGLATVLARIADGADADDSGDISKDEAYSSADFMVGGFFFRADANTDGTISPAEGKAVREELVLRYPSTGFLLRQSAGEQAQSSLGTLAELLDVKYGKSISASETRRAAHLVVDQVFLRADSDKDGKLTIAEARSASWEGVKAVGRAAFQATDENSDNKLSLEEFRSALDAPSKVAFEVSDADHDGTLTESEAAIAMSRVVSRLWIPEEKAPNSPAVAKVKVP